MGIKEFFKTIVLSFNPNSYKELSQRKVSSAVKHFLGVLLVAFIIMCLLFIPKLFSVPQHVYDELGSFDSLDVDTAYEMDKPIVITKNKPVVTVDLTEKKTVLKQGVLLIAEDYIEYKILPFTKPKRVDTEDMSNITDNKKSTAIVATILFLLLLPAIILYYYIILMIKYAIIILIATVLGFVIARLAKFDITLKELLVVGLFASTVMIIVELITKPFVPNIYYIQYLVFALCFIAGAIKAGEFVPQVKEGKLKKSKN